MFGRKKRMPIAQIPPTQPKPKPQNDGCDMRLKRDKIGRIVGIKTSGKCTKEDKMIFAQDNNIEVKEIESTE